MKLTEKLRVQGQNARARGMKCEGTLTVVEWEQTIKDFDGMCAYCNIRPFVALEHFIPFGQEGAGTYVNNCLPACQKCNNTKKNRGIEYTIQKFGSETVVRLQTYLAGRSRQADKITEPAPRKPRPTSPEEITHLKIYGGINGREPKHGDEVELACERGIVYRKVERVITIYNNYRRPNDYLVRLVKNEYLRIF